MFSYLCTMQSTEPTPFEQFKLNRQLLNAIEEAGYTEPTPIQQQAIPLALAGHDVLGIAQTGTGKTAAFVLPMLMKIKFAQGTAPRALVLAPTRELVMQIAEAIVQLSQYTDIRTVSLYGGIGPKAQIEAVQRGADILVSTPRRFLDIYLKGEIVVKQLQLMVLDEADKMMDMGFMPQIRAILEVIPRKRQNMLFSATFQERVEHLAHEFLEFPMRVEVTPSATTADTVSHALILTPNEATKLQILGHLLLTDPTYSRVMVFARSKEIADRIARHLLHKILPTEQLRVIHGNKGQNTRINAMEAFKQGEVRVLVATDVAARGIDVIEVSHVINFDVPLIYEDYVHRIGRTGRANQKGTALTFITEADEYHIKKIEATIRTSIPRLPIPKGITPPETSKEERQAQLLEIDNQRRREDPTFKGAFHEKKKRPTTAAARPKSATKSRAAKSFNKRK